uniref:Uncharacterized protein n=1 Tax=Tanacetum cinerariifolium TaxID=118510 RepID=A0A6L2JLN2_TANCI|nr:hypothetical protein [Tanacetum cinerariifolium]
MVKTNSTSENEACWLVQVESRLVEHKDREIKYCEKIRGLEFGIESNNECIEIIKKKLEILKKEKEGVYRKLAGFLTASKDLDNLIESQRVDKNKDGLGYSAAPPPPAQIYSSPKKDMSWTGLSEFSDDTVTDYSRPSPTIESTSGDDQNKNPSLTKTEASPSTISPKPFIKFVKAAERSTTNKVETVKKPSVKLGVKMGRSSPKNNYTHRSMPSRLAIHRTYRPPMRPVRLNMNAARLIEADPGQQWLGFLRRSDSLKGNSGAKLEDAMRSRGVVDYILQVKKKLLTKNLKDSEAEHQV